MLTVELLQTKLQKPRVPRHFVLRPRLLERLDDGVQGPLTLVTAGAGYGKTSLVSSWVAGLPASTEVNAYRPVAWVSLDERESDLGFFLRYLVASVQTIFPDACAATASLVQAMRQPPFEWLSTTLINDLARLPQDFVLVLDDYHLVTGLAVAELLGTLERHWPKPLHLVLISRHAPALGLAHLRAKGMLAEIRARDLRFTTDEVDAYLRHAVPAPLSHAAVEQLTARTEGWIAGLQLTSLVLKDAEDPEGQIALISVLDAEFADYLTQDVLAHQPPAILSFLLQTSILDSFSVALCDAVVVAEDPAWRARQCLDWLERCNLFVVALDGHKEWYRYHHMFRSLLSQRMAGDLGPEHINGLHRRAAVWLATHGHVDEALAHALAAEDRALAAEFVVQALCSALNREDRPTLDRWLSLFADEFVWERADLLIVQGFTYGLAWQFGATAKVAARAAALFEQESLLPSTANTRALRGCLYMLSAACAFHSDDTTGATMLCRQALAYLPAEWLYVRGHGMLYLALSFQAEGRGDEALRLLSSAYEDCRKQRDVFCLRLLQGLCFLMYIQGEDLDRVIETAQKLTLGAAECGLNLLKGWGHLMCGLAHYQRNELPAACESIANVLEMQFTCNVGALCEGMLRMALLHQVAGEETAADEIVRLLVQLDLEQAARVADDTQALRARLQLMRGELDRAAQWADGFTAPVPDHSWLWQDPPHWIKARILIARGTDADLRRAMELLDDLLNSAERRHNVRLKIEVAVLRGLALEVAGKRDEARQVQRTAQELARPGGYTRVFQELGRQNGVPLTPVYMPVFGMEGDQDAPPPVEPLTQRELEILLHLREPASLKEIAHQLSISYLTARRHTANIYGKLGVNERAGAVVRGSRLGLIPPR